MSTQVSPIQPAFANMLRLLLVEQLPRLTWRRHGIGCLQAYLQDGSSTEYRVHIWHPDLFVSGMEKSGQLHNHRFQLTSHVLAGEVGHTELTLASDAHHGEWQVFDVVHARKAEAQKKYELTPNRGLVSDLKTGERSNRVAILSSKLYRLPSGLQYTFEKGAFHKSTLRGPAVTLVEKSEQTDSAASILAPYGHTPIHGFGHAEVDPEAFVQIAVTMLREEIKRVAQD